MSGKRYLLDTNAIVALLDGNQAIADLIAEASWVDISIISELEFLAFDRLSADDEELFGRFRARVEIIDLSQAETALLGKVVEFRKSYRLKLPDAIVAASAFVASASLVTADKGFQKVKEINVIEF